MPPGFHVLSFGDLAFLSVAYFLLEKHFSRKTVLDNAKRELEILKLSSGITQQTNSEILTELATLKRERVLFIANVVREEPFFDVTKKSMRTLKWLSPSLRLSVDFRFASFGGLVCHLFIMGHIVLVLPLPTRADLMAVFLYMVVFTLVTSLMAGCLGVVFEFHSKCFAFLMGVSFGCFVDYPLTELIGWSLHIAAKIATAYGH